MISIDRPVIRRGGKFSASSREYFFSLEFFIRSIGERFE
jgi:hypothetical protein